MGKNQITEEDFYPLISLGLIFQERSDPTPITKSEYAASEGYGAYYGGEIEFFFHLTLTGHQLLKYYSNLFPKE